MPDLTLPLALVAQLNAMAAGSAVAPEAEARLRADGRPHHVLDADSGFSDAETVTLRRALAWMGGNPTPWALLVPSPGRPGGLRGPASLNAAALERGAAVVRHDGGVAWLCDEVGEGVQWTLVRAERPVLPDDPRSASRALAATMAEVAESLRHLETAGERPHGQAPRLGSGYPPASQVLLDRAWTLRLAAEAAADPADANDLSSHVPLSSHVALQRERALRPLAGAADAAISSAASWPSFAMIE